MNQSVWRKCYASYIDTPEVRRIIRQALAEDIGRYDITTKLLFSVDRKIYAVIIAGENGIICGINIAWLVFKLWDNSIRFIPQVREGARVRKGQTIARLSGRVSSILSGERVALNFLGLLSGIATRTNQFVSKVKNYKVKIMDTRKTLPGLRTLEKYAVRIGGGYNHRFTLDEMILIKENHLAASGLRCNNNSIKKIIDITKERKSRDVKLEIEVRNLREFKEALRSKPDIIMLDNMRIEDIQRAVEINRREQLENPARCRTMLEASGNINLKNIRAYARTGVDFISLGTLTKDVHSLDLSLEINKGGR